MKLGNIRYTDYSDSASKEPKIYEYPETGNPSLADIETWAGLTGIENSLEGTLEENIGDILRNYPETAKWFEEQGIIPTSEDAEKREIKLRECIQSYVEKLYDELNSNQELRLSTFISMMTPSEKRKQETYIKEEIAEIEEILKSPKNIQVALDESKSSKKDLTHGDR